MGHPSKKITKSHSSAIEVIQPVITFLEKDPHVTKISLGRIKSGLRNVGGIHRLKIKHISPKTLRISARGNISHQEITAYTNAPQQTGSALMHYGKETGFQVVFEDHSASF